MIDDWLPVITKSKSSDNMSKPSHFQNTSACQFDKWRFMREKMI